MAFIQIDVVLNDLKPICQNLKAFMPEFSLFGN